MRKLLISLCVLGLAFTGYSQSSTSELDYTVILVGDAGEHKPYSQPLLDKVTERLNEFDEDATVIFLGDNIYPVGLPMEEDKKRIEMEGKLAPQVEVINESQGEGFIIPGNHDWAKGREYGLENILEQQEFVDAKTKRNDAFQPRDGCPGPVEIPLNDNLVLIVVDTQWLLVEKDDLPRFAHCPYKTPNEVTNEIEAIVSRNQDKHILFTAHHPIHTYGSHGGVYPFKMHLFPLTDMKKWLYLPLPVIGSIYPWYRSSIGNIQDATNQNYQQIMSPIVASLESHPRAIHAAGHEHALEHTTSNGVEYIVSGSGSKMEFVKKKNQAAYVCGDNGFGQLYYYADGSVQLEFWVFNKRHPQGKVLYDVMLFTPRSVE